MKFELGGTRIDATGFNSEAQAKAELESKTRVPLTNGQIAVIVSPWEIQTAHRNAGGHGWGVTTPHVYAVARFVAVSEADQYDLGKVLLAYRRKLREAIKSATFESDAKWAKDEIARIEPRIFGLGLGFEK